MCKLTGGVARLLAFAACGGLVLEGQSKPVCPTYVELQSGTIFDIAKLVEDSGSPTAALKKARTDLAQVKRYGGCKSLEHTRHYGECTEIVAAAEEAISALERCVSRMPRTPLIRRRVSKCRMEECQLSRARTNALVFAPVEIPPVLELRIQRICECAATARLHCMCAERTLIL